MAATTTDDTVNGSFGTIDFTNLPYVQGATASYNTANNVLTVDSGPRNESVTLNNPGQASFQTSSDGAHGTDVAGAGGSTVAINSTPAGTPVPMSPSDNIVQITFNNDKLAGGTNYATTGTLSGSVNVDYTTGTTKGVYSFTVNGQTETFTNPGFLAGPNNFLTVAGSGDNNASNELYFTFSSQQPTNVNPYISIQDSASGSALTFGGQAAATSTPLCFASGTLIRTAEGDRAVERLRVGDLAVTASGAARPIRWIGHRAVDCGAQAVPSHWWPVRVRAGAFGVGACGADLPERDLFLSPGHPVLVGTVLVPVMCLINGTSIARAPVDRVTYWHVELDAHDLLLTEGLPAESYVDGGSRAWFGDAAIDGLANPDHVAPGAARCRPVATDGAVVDAERRRLDAIFAADLARASCWPTFDGDVAAP